MGVFVSTLNQTAFLFTFIVIGYILGKFKIIPDNSATVLSKLENNLFVPALVLGTFIKNFTVSQIASASKIFLSSIALVIIMILFSLLASKLVTKDGYERNIFAYGLAFSNFGFMGNAVVEALFPDIFLQYIIFTLPFWSMIYLWGAPTLLIGGSGGKQTIKERAKAFLNPMFIAIIIGMIIGIVSDGKLPWGEVGTKEYESFFLTKIIDVSGSCMSPVAMLLTGITVSGINIKKTFTDMKIYAVSVIRLIFMPFIFLAIAKFVPFITADSTIFYCALCVLSMPLGLNTIVIPSAYGKDTSKAAGMAVISHLLSCLTIPAIFMAVEMLFRLK